MSAAPFAGRDDEEDDAEEEEAAAVEEEEEAEEEEEEVEWEADEDSTAASAACKILPYWCFEGSFFASFFFAAGAFFLWLFFPFFPDPTGRPGPRFFAGGSTSADDDAAADEDAAPFLWLFVSFTRGAFFLWLFLSCVPVSPSSPSSRPFFPPFFPPLPPPLPPARSPPPPLATLVGDFPFDEPSPRRKAPSSGTFAYRTPVPDPIGVLANSPCLSRSTDVNAQREYPWGSFGGLSLRTLGRGSKTGEREVEERVLPN